MSFFPVNLFLHQNQASQTVTTMQLDQRLIILPTQSETVQLVQPQTNFSFPSAH